jgi:serine/threonine-protein kinase
MLASTPSMPDREPTRSQLPRMLGRYELVERLAEGGMGEIFLARQVGAGSFEKLVVIKRLLPELEAREPFRSMFLEEARLTARLSHSNVCEVYELGEDAGQCFLAMQYLEGAPLGRLLETSLPVTAVERIRLLVGIIQQACEGLHHAHELRGADGQPLCVVHRDVSPSNVFVTAEGVAKVLDFGIAKARDSQHRTDTGMVKGKYAYMSPEQVRGEALDRRSDVFALGILALEAVSGRHPFLRGSDPLTAMAILNEEAPRADQAGSAVPAALADVIARALAKAPPDRFPTARAFGDAAAGAIAQLGNPMSAPQIGPIVAAAFGADLARQRRRHDEASRPRPGPEAPTPVDRAEAPPAEGPPTVLARPRLAGAAAVAPAPAPRRRPYAVLIVASAVPVMLLAIWLAPRAPPTLARPNPVPSPVASAPSVAPAPPVPRAPEPAEREAPRSPASRRTRSGSALEPGFFSVDSVPYAQIFVDDRKVGVTPLIGHPLPPGVHRIRARLESGKEQSMRVRILPGVQAPPRNLRWRP